MRKRIVSLTLALACLAAAAGTGAIAAEESQDAPSLYDRGLEVVRVLSEMVRSEE